MIPVPVAPPPMITTDVSNRDDLLIACSLCIVVNVWAYDDIYLANKNHFTIMQVSGSDFNIKITKPEDLKIAERYLK